jgi:hypothetical protein
MIAKKTQPFEQTSFLNAPKFTRREDLTLAIRIAIALQAFQARQENI